jgi:hypothetical protein
MALIGFNGGLIGKQRSAFTVIAPGLWTANEQVMLKRAGLWLPVSDSDAAAYIAAVEAADGQLLEDGVKSAINTFVVGCKADGIWTAIKASCILAGARTLAGALVPLVGTAPTNNSFVSGDYNRETGLVGDGSTKHLNSNRAGNTDPQNSFHCSIFIGTAATSGGGLFPVYIGNSGLNGRNIYRDQNNGSVIYELNGGGGSGSGTSVNFAGVIRTSASSVTGRFGGTSTVASVTSAAPLGDNIGIFGAPGGNLSITRSNARLAFYSIGESLDLALLDTRVTTLINAIAAAIP